MHIVVVVARRNKTASNLVHGSFRTARPTPNLYTAYVTKLRRMNLNQKKNLHTIGASCAAVSLCRFQWVSASGRRSGL